MCGRSLRGGSSIFSGTWTLLHFTKWRPCVTNRFQPAGCHGFHFGRSRAGGGGRVTWRNEANCCRSHDLFSRVINVQEVGACRKRSISEAKNKNDAFLPPAPVRFLPLPDVTRSIYSSQCSHEKLYWTVLSSLSRCLVMHVLGTAAPLPRARKLAAYTGNDHAHDLRISCLLRNEMSSNVSMVHLSYNPQNHTDDVSFLLPGCCWYRKNIVWMQVCSRFLKMHSAVKMSKSIYYSVYRLVFAEPLMFVFVQCSTPPHFNSSYHL